MSNKKFFRNRCPGIASRLVLAFALTLFMTGLSEAAGIAGDSRTYLQARESIDGSNIFGLYEYLDFTVQNIGRETISFHTGGWLRYDLGDDQFGRNTNNDLQYSYLSYRAPENNTIVNLGRVMIFEGVAAERVDGVYARTDLKGGFNVSGFGGSPVYLDTNGNDLICGARIGHQGDSYRVGVSSLREEKDNDEYRKERGFDLWLHPANKVDFTGRSSYNAVTKEWMEHSYVLTLGPFEKLRLNTEATSISYDDYFFRATTSAFTLGGGVLTPHEKVRILGQDASYPVTDKLSVTADYKNFSYDIAGSADYYGAKIKYAYSDSSGSGFSYHRMNGESDRLQYHEYRLYGYKKIAGTDLAIDLVDVSYDAAVNGVTNAYSLAVAALYELAEAWKVGADAEYTKNPFFDKELRAFIKVLYRFGAKGGV